MPDLTKNYYLKKPANDEAADIQVINENMDVLDAKLKEIDTKATNISVPVTSVNSKTGNVNLTAVDVGAETPTGAQAKVSAHEGKTDPHPQYALDSDLNSLSQSVNSSLAGKMNKSGGSFTGAITVPTEITVGGDSNTHLWFKNLAGLSKGLLYFQSTSDRMKLRKYKADGSNSSELALGDNDVLFNTSKIWHEGNDGSGSGLDADLLDGKDGASYLDYAKSGDAAYTTSNASNTDGGKWTKILTVSLDQRFLVSTLRLMLIGGYDGWTFIRRAVFDLRVKQSNAMGSAPLVVLNLIESNGLGATQIIGVITSNTASNTTVEFYVNVPEYETYRIFVIAKNSNAVCTFYNNQPFTANLPAGTQIACTDEQKVKIRTNRTIPITGWVDGTATTGFYSYYIADTDVTTACMVDVNVQSTDLNKATDLAPVTQSFDGGFKIYSYAFPAESYIIDYRITK